MDFIATALIVTSLVFVGFVFGAVFGAGMAMRAWFLTDD